jgi:phage repressor protein C with HTH and peptisase S24 domain
VAPRFDVKGKHVFAIRVEGDSMVPDLHPGDVLVINPERAFTNFKGGIGVMKYDESLK